MIDALAVNLFKLQFMCSMHKASFHSMQTLQTHIATHITNRYNKSHGPNILLLMFYGKRRQQVVHTVQRLTSCQFQLKLMKSVRCFYLWETVYPCLGRCHKATLLCWAHERLWDWKWLVWSETHVNSSRKDSDIHLNVYPIN